MLEQGITDQTGREITPGEIWDAFQAAYLAPRPALQLVEHETSDHGSASGKGATKLSALVRVAGREYPISGAGNGPIAAFVDALQTYMNFDLRVLDYHEHAISAGSDATAVAYVEVSRGETEVGWGVGMDANILTASLRALVSAATRHGFSGADPQAVLAAVGKQG